jgi:hypothetical protein
MSPSGVVIIRFVKPVPAPVVELTTMFAPRIKSLVFVVVADADVLVLLFPVADAATSTGFT